MSNYKKYANEILDDVECYKMVLNGTLRTFPRNFWTKPWSYESSSLITRYLFEERLKINIEDIPKLASRKFFIDNKLGGMCAIVFNGSPVLVVENAYPNKFKPWDFKTMQQNFWDNEDNVIKAMRWLIEDKLKWNKEQIKKHYNKGILVANGLKGISNTYGIYKPLNMLYPNVFKEWEISQVPNGYWTDEKIVSAIKWLIEDKLKCKTKGEVLKRYDTNVLKENGLATLTSKNIFSLLDMTYPNEFKPWELKHVEDGFWTEENIAKAMKWLIEDKLKIKALFYFIVDN